MSHQTVDYMTLMREQGFRVTPQRQLILDAICAGGGHTPLNEIYARVRAKSPAIHRATLYRAVDFLCELRLVVAADIGGGHKVYEIASETPHHHLICRTCGKVEQISHKTVKALFAKVEREQHFTIDMDHLTLFGLCQKCRRTSKRARSHQ